MLFRYVGAKAVTKKSAKRDRKKRQIYSGQLAKPGPLEYKLAPEGQSGDVESLLFGKRTAEEIKAHNSLIIKSEEENFLLLMDHYGIDRDHENGWCLLAFALARDHVPAFMPPSRGRPKEIMEQFHVHARVKQKIATNNSLSVDAAVGFVQKEHYPGEPKKTISSSYYKAENLIKGLKSREAVQNELMPMGPWSITFK